MKSRKLLALFLAFLCFATSAKADPYAQLIKGGSGGWLNVTRPLTEEDFKGKAVVLDFWTYGCINCMQIIPDLEYLEGRFGNKLLIVGVHSAKFEGESGNSRIVFAAKRFGLKHPVINDADFAIWKSYNVKAWPTQVLLGPDGQEVARWSGEGHRKEIEKAIARLDIKTEGEAAPVANDTVKTALSFPARTKVEGNFIYIADAGHNQIVITDKSGKTIQRIGSGAKGFADGTLEESQFNAPRGFATKGDKIYIADTGNHRLRLIDLGAKTVTTLVGDGKRGSIGAIASPWDLAFADDNQIAIANAGTHQLLSYDIKDNKLSVLAGSGREDIIDGKADDAALAQPSGLFYDNGVLYFVDAESSALRQLKEGEVKTLIGTGLFDFGLKDGKYPEARLQHPQGLSVSKDKVYVADTYNNVIRIYDLKTSELSTLALNKKFNEPGDISIVGGEAYIVDTNNNAISRLNLESGEIAVLPVK